MLSPVNLVVRGSDVLLRVLVDPVLRLRVEPAQSLRDEANRVDGPSVSCRRRCPKAQRQQIHLQLRDDVNFGALILSLIHI